ncbi:hypothetical protein SSP0624 [Staphylococcus saprophyticus subsp. saprophyticus ATCC 15305]|uniref:Uncharacterized protein n=1 Tax=Staphylococcus saprophyticus subsp. saprophyticus (strain ATCC 15305 / DSM 20229 / NCIMB 8711 / NCTC 7292 / S-41) TaxID=342451 RepID=Q49ZK7_STAS1|nr:hypothetical protein SSP0624 [Staphylococcus saprophyticus subsp. saprophyticus ATCC 15305] [Staphylococcus saprophyticus subsp. saprophyticus ATCC 15305 = NCTC 7292]
MYMLRVRYRYVVFHSSYDIKHQHVIKWVQYIYFIKGVYVVLCL